ncbi:hypothetical protein EJ07DRAFT_103374, partial [Lizonia empirigonia]
ATGNQPLNPSIVVDKFTQEESEASSNDSNTSVYSSKDWLKVETLIRNITTDRRSKDTQKVLRSLHHITIQNQLLDEEIQGLKSSLKRKKKQSKKSYTLPLQQRQEYYGGAVMWSPSKRREAEHRYDVVQRLDIEEQLKKTSKKELAAAKKLVEEQEKEDRRVAREAAAEVRRQEKEDYAKGVAERKAQRERLKLEHDAAKALQLSQKGKRKASQATGPRKRSKRVNIGDVGGGAPQASPPAPPPRITSRGRNVKLPAKFK